MYRVVKEAMGHIARRIDGRWGPRGVSWFKEAYAQQCMSIGWDDSPIQYSIAPCESFRILTEFSGVESPFQFSAPYTLSCINLHWPYQYRAPSFSLFKKYTLYFLTWDLIAELHFENTRSSTRSTLYRI